MGKPTDQLPPSEALPGIGEHCIVFHNGNGFYYFCKEFSSFLEKRLFQCVRQDCEVTATMGEGCGSPLIDSGVHCHHPDLTYREKCLLIHNIRQQFQAHDMPASLILREALSFIEENEESRTSSPQNFECVTLPNDVSFVELKQEQADTEIEIEEEDAKDIILKTVGETMTVDQLLGAMENRGEEQLHSPDSQPTTSRKLKSLHQKKEESDDEDDYDDDDGDEDYSLTEGSNKRKPRLKLVKPNAKKQDSAQSKKVSKVKDETARLTTLHHRKWKNEKIVALYGFGCWDEDYIFVVTENDPKGLQQKALQVLTLVDESAGIIPNISNIMIGQKVFLYVSQKQIVGCMMASPVTQAFKSTVSEFKINIHSNEVYPVQCGISHIWTIDPNSTHDTASKLLDTIRRNFCYGHILAREDIAFHLNLTPDNKQFVSEYMQDSNIFVYTKS